MINSNTFDKPETYVPPHIRSSLVNWVAQGIPAGSFIEACLENNLAQAHAKADHINKLHVGTIVAWLWCYAPVDSWGSPKAVAEWEGLAVNGGDLEASNDNV